MKQAQEASSRSSLRKQAQEARLKQISDGISHLMRQKTYHDNVLVRRTTLQLVSISIKQRKELQGGRYLAIACRLGRSDPDSVDNDSTNSNNKLVRTLVGFTSLGGDRRPHYGYRYPTEDTSYTSPLQRLRSRPHHRCRTGGAEDSAFASEADKRPKGQAIQFFYWKTLSTNEKAEWRWGRGLRKLQSNASKEYQAHRGWQENWMMLPSLLCRGESDMT
ncbi:hypothetical protein J6590_088794 [Homalodisca vitripennis]|nr:hypothetical protein J6590_088794 [Homalodisca vitripennis]